MIKRFLNQYKNLSVQIKASMWFLICSFLQKGISVITTPIFTRLLSTAEYGNYNVFNSWLGIVSIFVSLDLYAGVYTQGLVKFDQKRKTFSSSFQGLTLTLVFIWSIVYLLFSSYWNNLLKLSTVQMVSMISLIWTSAVFNLWASEQRVDYKYRNLVIITLIVSLLKPIVGIVLVINANDKVTARIAGLVLVELICYTPFFFIQLKRGRKFFDAYFWKYGIMYNIPLIPHYLSQSLLSSSDRIMIKSMVGESEAGIYSLAYSIALLMTLFNKALSHTISPWIYKKIKRNATDEIENKALGALLLIAIVNIILIILAPEIVFIFAPNEYRKSFWLIPPIAMSTFFMFEYDLFAKFEFYFEKTVRIMIASVLGATLNVLLNYIFIQSIGYQAAAYTTLICYVIYSFMHYLFMVSICKNEGIKTVFNIHKLLFISVGFVLIGFSVMLLYNNTILRYLCIAIMFIFIICFRNKVKSVLNNILKK